MLERMKKLLHSPYVLVAAAAIGLLVVLGLVYWLGWLGPWFWVVVALLAGVGIFVGLRWGVPWLRERQFVQQEGSEFVAAGEESPEEFRAKFAKALQMLRALPQLKGKSDPVYALPWYLLIGAPQSGKTAAVHGATAFSALLPASGDGGTQNFDWWVSNSALVLDTAGRYAVPVDAARDRAEWYRLLRLLRHHRQFEPINGLLLTVGADWLAAQPDDVLRVDASKLRDRIEEAVRELGSDFPIYLVVTKSDGIEGFAEFFGRLPERVFGEVLGYIDDPASAPAGADGQGRGAPALRRLAAGLQSMYERLHLFRLVVLGSQIPEEQRLAAFAFPEEFKALAQSLVTFAEPLFSEDVRYHTPLLRGVFLTSAQQAGTRCSLLRRQFNLGDEVPAGPAGAKHYFLGDLFDSILPRERGLVTTTARERRRRGVLRSAALGVLAVVAVLLAAFGVRALATDRHILASVDPGACPEPGAKGTTGPHVESAERCRVAVQTVSEQNQRRARWSTWIFNRSGQLETSLRERYIQQFKTAVLEPLNVEMDRAFDTSRDPLPLMLLVAQRAQISRRCVSAAGCPERMENLDFALMLNPGQDRRAPPDTVAALRQDFTAYALWQGAQTDLLQQDLAADQKRLRQWLSAKQFTLDKLLPLVNKHSAPLSYDNYWELPAPVAAVAPAQIEPACTKQVWEQDVAPFLQQLQDAVPDAAPKLRAFQEQYRATCLAQWQRFLTGFAAGTERWQGADRRRTLALRLVSPASPVSRVIDDAMSNLSPWLPAAGTAGAPGWAERLRKYATSADRTAYQDALTKIGARFERGDVPETSLKLAQETFTDSKVTADSTSPVLRAAWSANQAEPEGTDPQKRDEQVLRSLLVDPLRFVWRVILEGAGAYLQKAWADTVMAQVKGLPPAEQAVQLYGPGGKVALFADQFLRPFLGGEPPGAATVLGEALPLSAQFQQVLGNARELKPVLEGGGAPLLVAVNASGRSQIESQPTVLGEETIFSITCGGKAYRVTSRPQSPEESSVTVPWTSQGCGDVTLTVYFLRGETGAAPGALPAANRLQLTKTYAGKAGFLQFLQAFAAGSHRLTLEEFPGGDPDALRSGVSAITISYRIEAPPELGKLIATMRDAALPEDIVAPSAS